MQLIRQQKASIDQTVKTYMKEKGLLSYSEALAKLKQEFPEFKQALENYYVAKSQST